MKLTQIINYFFTKKISWTIIPEYQQSTFKQLLANFNDAYHYNEKADCEFITKSPLCRVYKIQINSKNYYFKKYNISRKKIQRYLGQSKVQTEWNNLLWFKSVQIPVAKVVAYGMETKGWVHHRGLLITEELINTSDLDSIRTSQSILIKKNAAGLLILVHKLPVQPELCTSIILLIMILSGVILWLISKPSYPTFF